jgi:ubiquinone/menaquinone biosynthesis C-methylase UbiE
MSLLDDKYKDLYSAYYEANSSLEHKRGLSADSSLEHIQAVSGSSHRKRLIDVGAGNGSVLAKLDQAGIADELYAVEISESGVSAIKDLRLSRLKGAKIFDGYKIDFPDKFFDIGVCMHVLEHVEHERLFLRELSRVAKELIIEVPLDGGIRISRSIRESYKFGHLNYYTVPSLLFLLETVGLVTKQYIVTTSSPDYERHLYGGLRGTIKSAIRRGALKLMPNLAPWMFSYLMTVRCVPKVDEKQ